MSKQKNGEELRRAGMGKNIIRLYEKSVKVKLNK